MLSRGDLENQGHTILHFLPFAHGYANILLLCVLTLRYWQMSAGLFFFLETVSDDTNQLASLPYFHPASFISFNWL